MPTFMSSTVTNILQYSQLGYWAEWQGIAVKNEVTDTTYFDMAQQVINFVF